MTRARTAEDCRLTKSKCCGQNLDISAPDTHKQGENYNINKYFKSQATEIKSKMLVHKAKDCL